MSTLPELSVAKRVTIVERVGSLGDGGTLAGQNVANFPAGSLFWVRDSNRFYMLRKVLDPLVVAEGSLNVIDGVGSSATNGRFVAVQQFASVVLSGGTATQAGFDLSAGGFFLTSLVTPGGTPGFLRAAKSTANTATITSTNAGDTSTVLIVFVEAPTDT